MVPDASWQSDGLSVQPLQGFEHGAVVLLQQAVGHMQPIVRIDADQMGIKRRVMDL
jgi:hypothetical protein